MNKLKILETQLETDLEMLLTEIKDGLYQENTADFIKEWDRIKEKSERYIELRRKSWFFNSGKMAQLMRLTEAIYETFKNRQWICPECKEIRIGDLRLKSGLKCSVCAM